MGKCKRHQGSADHEVLVMEFPHQIRPGWPKSSNRWIPTEELRDLLSLSLNVRLQELNVVYPKGLG
jgi:hypothetical protein